MVSRLAAHAALRLRLVYYVTIPILTFALVKHAMSNSVGALAGSTVLTLLIGPLLAFGRFNSRVYATLPVSRREYGLARWALGTLFAAISTSVARTAALYVVGPMNGPGFAAVFSGALTDFLLCGACFGIAALTISSPPVRALRIRLSTKPLLAALAGAAVEAVFVILVAIFTFAFVGVTAMPRESSGSPVSAMWVFGVAGLLTLIGVRARPSTRFSSMARAAAAPAIRRGTVQRRADTPVGLRLLARREITGACKTSLGLLATVWVVMALHNRTIFPSDAFLRLFDVTIPHGDASGRFPLLVIFLPPFLVPGPNGLAASLRHLRTLPLSATRLNALFLVQSVAYWLLFIALFSLLCVGTAGRLPHVEAAAVMLCIGIAVLFQSAQLLAGGTLSASLVILLPLFVVFWLVTVALPFPFDALTHPASLGVILLCVAAVANAWILRRSTSFRRPATAFLLARREC